jgi:cardiolipin synthase
LKREEPAVDVWVVVGTLVGVAFVALVVWTAVVVVPKDRKPTSALAWMLVFYLVPVLGLLTFFVIGSPKLPASRRARQAEVDRRLAARTVEELHGVGVPDHPPWLAGVVRQNLHVGRLPMVRGNSAVLHGEYDDAIQRMADDIATARQFVHVEFFILSVDDTSEPFFAALEKAVANGAEVRVLLDHLGSRTYPGFSATLERLSAMGARWSLMLPVQPLKGRYQRPDLRNHRKLVVVDGVVGWAGSQNLIESPYQKPANHRRGLRWKDLMVRLTGPVVQELDAVFVTDWYSETDEVIEVHAPSRTLDPTGAGTDGTVAVQVLPSGPAYDTDNNLLMFNSLIHAAERRLSVTSPYFVPDESLLNALVGAALRGVAVELFVPEQADQFLVHHAQRSYFDQLLRAGVRIWLYPSPTVLHAKHVSVDDEVAVVGSSNLDIRSFALDLESSLLLHDRAFVDSLREIEDGYRAVSRELTLAEWEARPRRDRVVDNLARLTSAVM